MVTTRATQLNNMTQASFSSDEILSYLSENGTIDLRGVENEMRKTRRKSLLAQHAYTIYQGKDGRWYSYLPDEKSGRKKIVKPTKEKLEDQICEFYDSIFGKDIEDTITLRSLYPAWIEYKRLHVQETTVLRIQKSWRRHYENSKIVDKPIRELKKIDLDVWVHKMIKEYDMDKHQYGNFSMILKQELDYAVSLDVVTHNPFDQVKVDKKRVLRPERKKPSSTQVFTKDELDALFDRAWKSFEKRENTVHELVPLAVMFMFLTGVRLGEVAALKFSDITDSDLTVMRAVRYPDGAIIDHTKGTFGDRLVPLVPQALKLVELARERQTERGIESEYIFTTVERPILTYAAIQKAFDRYCADLEITKRSAHKARKTFVSTLLDSGINLNTVREYVGHMDEKTTLNNYAYDRSTDVEKYNQLTKALA